MLAWVSPYGRYEVKKIRNAANDAAAVEKFVIESGESALLVSVLTGSVTCIRTLPSLRTGCYIRKGLQCSSNLSLLYEISLM